MNEPTESEIVRGLKAGRREAWLALYDGYAGQVWRCVARLMGSECTDVADVVQETFLAAARSANSFDPARGTLWTWLWGISRNQVLLHYRKRKRDPEQPPLDRPDDLGSAMNSGFDRWIKGTEDAPPDLLESKELAGLVRAALTELPEDYCLMLIAKYLEGESIEQIARKSGFSPDAVMSKLARARRALREKLLNVTGSRHPQPKGAKL